MRIRFTNTNNTPSEGYFYEINGERVTAARYIDIEKPVADLMRKYGVEGTVEAAVAAHMCPRIHEAPWMCTGGDFKTDKVFPKDALKNSEPYTSRQVVTFDIIERRLRTCSECPKHTREFCVTCTGHAARLEMMFRGRRPPLPEDRASGICKLSRAYEIATASVEYADDEPLWDDTPETCWRRTECTKATT